MPRSPGKLLDRSQPPLAGPPRDFRFPPFESYQLEGGFHLLAARHGRVPLVSLGLLFPAGGHFQEPGQAGLASFTAALLEEGTEKRTSAEIAAFVDRIGASLDVEVDWNVSEISIQLLSQHLDSGLELVAELASQPTFPSEEVERVRKRRLADLLRRTDRPALLAQDQVARALYGDSVYGRPLKGTSEILQGLDEQAVASFYRGHYRLEGAILVAVGDLDPEEMARRAEGALRGCLAGAAPSLPGVTTRPRSGLEIYVVDRPGAAQTELRLAHELIPRTHPDYLPLTLMNTIFGGKFTSRINLTLRERDGYTYGASSRVPTRLGPGPFLVGAAVETEFTGASTKEVLEQVRRLRRELVSESEIEDARSYLQGVFPYTLQTLDGLAHRLEALALFGLPADYYDKYPQALKEVSREAIQEVAQKHLDPDRFVIVAVGPADVIEPQLAPLGAVQRVHPEDLASTS